MKPAFYDSLDKIPETDRSDYKLVTETGSANFNKYVLDLDPQHPVALKNVELLGEKTTRDTVQNAAVAAAVATKDAEISRLAGELLTVKSQSGLPAGHIAVPADALTVLNNFKTLGEFDQVKTKIEGYAALKERDDAATRKNLFSEVARANNLNEDVFAKLAEPVKLQDKLESREIADSKGNTVKHWFVKGVNADGADTSTAIGDFVKQDGDFSPFLTSLTANEKDKNRVRVPNQKHGELPTDQKAGSSYVNRTYKRPDQKNKD